ncbi:hypothetical protein ACIO1C_35600 [Streptomyces sp. NPDC087420]|uniref:hypothetical protein n=1 Tax=Streptomyces sp. NPDC087420 TaxID=3365785 RepID=UPI00383300F5
MCVAVSGLGHALSSGGPVPLPALGGAFVMALGAGWWLTGRAHGAPVVVAASTVGQALLHYLFGVLPLCLPASVTAGTAGASGGGRSGMTMSMAHAHQEMSAESADLMALTMAYDGHSPTAGMAAAHVLAGLLCGWWLWRGETAIGQLARSLALFIGSPLRLARWVLSRSATGHRLPAARPTVPYRAPRRPGRRIVLDPVSRRGPPLLPSCR